MGRVRRAAGERDARSSRAAHEPQTGSSVPGRAWVHSSGSFRQTVQAACVYSQKRMRSLDPARYKWIALLNATLAVLLATLDGSITIIAMPSIFRGIHLDPLVPANSLYLLWMILGYLVVTSVLIVSLGRLGDMVGRVRMYNLGFVIYTLASLFLTVDWMTGRSG